MTVRITAALLFLYFMELSIINSLFIDILKNSSDNGMPVDLSSEL